MTKQEFVREAHAAATLSSAKSGMPPMVAVGATPTPDAGAAVPDVSLIVIVAATPAPDAGASAGATAVPLDAEIEIATPALVPDVEAPTGAYAVEVARFEPMATSELLTDVIANQKSARPVQPVAEFVGNM